MIKLLYMTVDICSLNPKYKPGPESHLFYSITQVIFVWVLKILVRLLTPYCNIAIYLESNITIKNKHHSTYALTTRFVGLHNNFFGFIIIKIISIYFIPNLHSLDVFYLPHLCQPLPLGYMCALISLGFVYTAYLLG